MHPIADFDPGTGHRKKKTPRATLRLQLHADFDFGAARRILDYCAALGVSHLYLSPITQARPGSTHGYDVIDPRRINPELGGLDGLLELAEHAAAYGIGLIVDIVPNHMAADARNPWWNDLLKTGRASPHARVFDIDWTAGGGRLVLPILDRPYDTALQAGLIRLSGSAGTPAILTGGQRLPLAEGTAPPDLDALHASRTVDPARLHAILSQQHYRLVWWRNRTYRPNWRRFFEIDDLVGICVEDPSVFELTHQRIIELYGCGILDGLRVDHIDGLAAPHRYLQRLHSALLQADPSREPYVVVEKILAPNERLDRRWPVAGTTGYDFMDDAAALLHTPSARRPLNAQWRRCGGPEAGAAAQLRETRRQVLHHHLEREREAVLDTWWRTVQTAGDPLHRGALGRLMDAWLVNFPCYRSYADDAGSSPADRAMWAVAARAARALLDPPDRILLEAWLGRFHRPCGGASQALRRMQQLTPPLAAKSLEDTFFYRYGPLLSRNEVGASPLRFSLGRQAFHRRNLWRCRHFPNSLLSTATHDHKRGEDTRARLAVISEMPAQWAHQAQQWLETLPRNAFADTDRYMLLQTLVGAWPVEWPTAFRQVGAAAIRDWLRRIAQWQIKALREAKLHTNWTCPDAAYESAAQACLHSLDPGATDPEPLDRLGELAQTLIAPGLINSISQTLLRNTAPGVPDLYQGAQRWDESLVDPDNRRPVDWTALDALLASAAPRRPGSAQWRSGRVKQYLIQACLRLRSTCPSAFEGPYQPLRTRGRRANNALAYLRGQGAAQVLVIVPRLCSRHIAGYAMGQAAAARLFWDDTAVCLPRHEGRIWEDKLADRRLHLAADRSLRLSEVLRHWPVTLCTAVA